ncbi:alpha/beta fold hydrolase [Streptomyces sp. VRA16 Mangrove soil]|uniref:alpha/beta fold hydrolase n=1 Tax=Streptomyces sp. VRA16 Mangrove soil TaxID=2817434 RepID=UPI001A9D7B24|nr:alpha/beta family hydrolase [Streptomyces sp. VRA16 Mangrove soil]MBO1332282.1 alpha/beta fold hydrolase [Streptomyces sp. VRA16 Mangrove soil]
MSAPLLSVRAPERPRAAVLMLHGGREADLGPSRPWHLAALRLRPFERAITAELPREDVLLARVRYRVRGWNGERADPVRDTLAALDELTALAGPLPTVLVGHSMGARAALHAAGHPQVYGLLALAPWWPRTEPTRQLTGRHVVVLHGTSDRVTSAPEAAVCVRRARGTAAGAAMALIRDGDHAMLRRAHVWHRTAAAVVAHLVDPEEHGDPLPPESSTAAGVPVL